MRWGYGEFYKIVVDILNFCDSKMFGFLFG